MSINLEETFKDVPGAQEFIDLLSTPDSIFDAMYPTLKTALKQQIQGEDFQEALKEVRNNEDYLEIIRTTTDFLDGVEESDEISENKKDLVRLLFSSFIGIMHDAEIFVEVLPGGILPTYANEGDAGADIYAPTDITIPANTMGVIVPTKLKVAIPKGWMLSIRPRSGISHKTKLRISNSPGTIDSGYRDEVGILIDNHDTTEYTISKGDRIAQFILEKVYQAKWSIIEDVNKKGENRNGGFGSTGK